MIFQLSLIMFWKFIPWNRTIPTSQVKSLRENLVAFENKFQNIPKYLLAVLNTSFLESLIISISYFELTRVNETLSIFHQLPWLWIMINIQFCPKLFLTPNSTKIFHNFFAHNVPASQKSWLKNVSLKKLKTCTIFKLLNFPPY